MNINEIFLNSEMKLSGSETKNNNFNKTDESFLNELQTYATDGIEETNIDNLSNLTLSNIMETFGNNCDSINKFFADISSQIEQNYINAQNNNDQDEMNKNYELAKSFFSMQSDYEDMKEDVLNAHLRRDTIPPYQKLL